MDNSRTELLIGEDNCQLIASKTVAIIGTGGVGGMVAISLCRCGVQNFTLVDFDKVSPSNCNRQVVAWQDTIGKNKVDVLKNMILAINPAAKVNAICKRVEKESLKAIFEKQAFDIVVDAIDSVADKVELICYCKNHDINIISAMGAGNRIGLPQFHVSDIYKTHDDALAKVMRKKLKERGVSTLQVVYSSEKPIKTKGMVGSIAYQVQSCALVICSQVINKILRREI